MSLTPVYTSHWAAGEPSRYTWTLAVSLTPSALALHWKGVFFPMLFITCYSESDNKMHNRLLAGHVTSVCLVTLCVPQRVVGKVTMVNFSATDTCALPSEVSLPPWDAPNLVLLRVGSVEWANTIFLSPSSYLSCVDNVPSLILKCDLSQSIRTGYLGDIIEIASKASHLPEQIRQWWIWRCFSQEVLHQTSFSFEGLNLKRWLQEHLEAICIHFHGSQGVKGTLMHILNHLWLS